MNKEILVGKKLLRHSQIEEITQNIAQKLDQRFEGSPNLPVMIGILKGAAPFMFDIVRKMHTIVDIELMDVSSYKGTKSTGKLNIKLGLSNDVAGKDVILVDDVIETGLTTYELIRYLKEEKHVNSVTTVFLIDKVKNRKYEVKVDFAGMVYEGDDFLIGYGLDYNNLLRNIFAVYEMDKKDIQKLDEISAEDHRITEQRAEHLK